MIVESASAASRPLARTTALAGADREQALAGAHRENLAVDQHAVAIEDDEIEPLGKPHGSVASCFACGVEAAPLADPRTVAGRSSLLRASIAALHSP
jgi:hypothetical protein